MTNASSQDAIKNNELNKKTKDKFVEKAINTKKNEKEKNTARGRFSDPSLPSTDRLFASSF